jgi:hypothetical protein
MSESAWGRKSALRLGKNDPEIPRKVDHATETPTRRPVPLGAAGKNLLTRGARHVYPATVFSARLI